MPNMLSFCDEGAAVAAVGAITPIEALVNELALILSGLAGWTVHVHLFQNDFAPILATKIGDFVECNFVGYGIVTQTPEAPAVNPPGWVQSDIHTSHFEAGVILADQTAYGYYVTDSTDALLLKARRLPAPFLFSVIGDYLDIVTNLQLADVSQVGP